MLCVRSERRRLERETLCRQIISKLVAAPTCHRRMLFLRVCPILFDLLSGKFIRRHFFLAIVQLAGWLLTIWHKFARDIKLMGFFFLFDIMTDDKVPNVRLRFSSLLPKLHSSLRGLDVETEKLLIMKLDSAVRWMVETEKDRDVKEELAKFFRWVEEREKKGQNVDEEEQDIRKEREEEQWDLLDSSKSIDSSKPRSFFVSTENAPVTVETTNTTTEE